MDLEEQQAAMLTEVLTQITKSWSQNKGLVKSQDFTESVLNAVPLGIEF